MRWLRLKYVFALTAAGLVNAVLFGWVPLLSSGRTVDRPPSRAVEAVRLTDFRPQPPRPQARRIEPRPAQKPLRPTRRPRLPRPVPTAAPPRPKIETAALNLEVNPRLTWGQKIAPPPIAAPPVSAPAPPAGFEIGQVDAAPAVISQVRPIYPFAARRRGVTGVVVVRFLVDEAGRVGRLSIVRADPPGVFEKSVLDAVSRWRFKPGVLKGKPVPTWVVAPIRFELKG